MKVLVTGGTGYKGSVLVPKLLALGHDVTVLDTCWFNDKTPARLWKDDIRNVKSLDGFEAVIHLAGIANDPCGELDAKLTWEVNVLGTKRLADAAVKAGCRQFIFASSASVYGVKDNAPVTEEDDLEPVSDYNKTKMCAERVLLSYADKIAIQIPRPATVCGYSPRFRADTIVNTLTMDAMTYGSIEIKSPQLYRPNIHIEDITDLYIYLLDRPQITGVMNAGFENLTILEMAQMVAKETGATLKPSTASMDKRSYCVSSQLLLSYGFSPKHTVLDAIRQIKEAIQSSKMKMEPWMMNLNWMRKHGWVRA